MTKKHYIMTTRGTGLMVSGDTVTVNGVFETAKDAMMGMIKLMIMYEWDDDYRDLIVNNKFHAFVTILENDGSVSWSVTNKINIHIDAYIMNQVTL